MLETMLHAKHNAQRAPDIEVFASTSMKLAQRNKLWMIATYTGYAVQDAMQHATASGQMLWQQMYFDGA
eukprot:2859654-Amphidinium_carterae.2